MEGAAHCPNSSLRPASERKIVIIIIIILLFCPIVQFIPGCEFNVDGDFCSLIYIIMAAIPVQLLICGSYNYFEYQYKIIVNHKTALYAGRCLLSADGQEFGHMAFGKRNPWIIQPLGYQGRAEGSPPFRFPPLSHAISFPESKLV